RHTRFSRDWSSDVCSSDLEQAIQVIGKTALLEFKDPAGNTVFTGSELRSATLTTDEYGRPAVSIELSREGAARFAELTARYLHTDRKSVAVGKGGKSGGEA